MPDLNGTICSAGGCLDVGDRMAVIGLQVPAELSFADPSVSLVAVVCAEHAHMLRAGATLVNLQA